MKLTITFDTPTDFTDGKGVQDLEGRTVTVSYQPDGRGQGYWAMITGLVAVTSHQGIWFRTDVAGLEPVSVPPKLPSEVAWDTVTSVVVH